MAARMAPMMKVAEITMSGLTPMSEATRGSLPWRMARPRLVWLTRYIQQRQGHRRHTQNQDLRGGDVGTAHLKGRTGQQRGIGFVVGLPDDHGQRLQRDRHADGRDQGAPAGLLRRGR